MFFLLPGLFSCAAPRNTGSDVRVDYSGHLMQMQSRMDSLIVSMRLMHRETAEKFSNLKIENTTTYLSVPDSIGKQYPTAVSNTTASEESKENRTSDTDLDADVSRLATEVYELRQRIDTLIDSREQVRQVSWWQLHKVDVYAVLFAMIIVGWLVKKRIG